MYINSTDDSDILCKNFVKIGKVTPDTTRLECVQQVSQQVSLTAFARWRHCIDECSFLFSYFLLEGDNAMLGWLHTRLCHTFRDIHKFANKKTKFSVVHKIKAL